ncbi:MAG: SNF2-related protein [Pseudomonadaceae bacterium]
MQGSLFDESTTSVEDLPTEARMPLNLGARKVISRLQQDLCAEGDALVIAGYSGLDQLLQLINQKAASKGHLRLLLGSEPGAAKRTDFSLKDYDFDREIRDYWLKKGISLRLSGQLIRCMELIRSGLVAVRYPKGQRRIHAKMYCTDQAVTLGSSNYTEPGLYYQTEANVRFTPKEKQRFQECWQFAEYLWSEGRDANQELLDLLENLLRFVSWQEALARACSELLEGNWATRYLNSLNGYVNVSLWPCQQKGIGQALYLLENQGGVLIADATGSGKTRMGAHLLRAVHDRIWSSSRGHKGSMQMVCPPLVAGNWEKERALCGFSMEVASQGMLSRLGENKDSALAMQMSSAQTLAVDEAHNFLNQSSKRTRHLLNNLADQVILFTATPINRSYVDLLRLIDILGADNFDDDVLATFERLNRSSFSLQDVHQEDLGRLQTAIASFTVRRTKSQLNTMVMSDPEAYRLPNGWLCRYPQHASRSYSLHESDADQHIANQISKLASNLKGIGHFEKPLVLPESLARQGITAERYLAMRLSSAGSLAKHHVMGGLRSSRLALYRHILGEKEALLKMNLAGKIESGKDDESGNMLQRIHRLKGKTPKNELGIPLPDWLCDEKEHIKACEAEIGCYEHILMRLEKLSGGREKRKVALLTELAARHEQVIAFDHFPLTLRYLQFLLKADEKDKSIEVLLGVGGSKDANIKLQKRLNPETGTGRVIALCSDALSEGVNLQRASAMVHLDMPSVVRYAEQRVGRIDRMDSPHEKIECWWPQDAAAFALKADEKFVARVEEVDSLIGGNLQLPEEMLSQPEVRIITGEDFEQEMQAREARSWDGIDDAFAPVRDLVEGSQALLGSQEYEALSKEQLAVLSRVSLVKAANPWMFICMAGDEHMAPRWIMLTSLNEKPLTSLHDIAVALRLRLGGEVESLEISHAAGKQLELFLTKLSAVEQTLLPRRKQRALEQMQQVLRAWSSTKGWIETQEQADQIKTLLDLMAGNRFDGSPDWASLADCWLDLVRPVWASYLDKRGKKAGITRLKDIYRDLIAHPLPASRVLARVAGIKLRQQWEERIVACIVGV